MKKLGKNKARKFNWLSRDNSWKSFFRPRILVSLQCEPQIFSIEVNYYPENFLLEPRREIASIVGSTEFALAGGDMGVSCMWLHDRRLPSMGDACSAIQTANLNVLCRQHIDSC